MAPASQDSRAGGDRGYRLGAGDPWAARLERMAAALAYRETGDPFAGIAATSGAAPAAASARGARRLSAAMSLVFTRIRLG